MQYEKMLDISGVGLITTTGSQMSFFSDKQKGRTENVRPLFFINYTSLRSSQYSHSRSVSPLLRKLFGRYVSDCVIHLGFEQ